jgi:hypothetical protein
MKDGLLLAGPTRQQMIGNLPTPREQPSDTTLTAAFYRFET